MQRTEEGEIIRGPINDERLKPGMNRSRSGSSQHFNKVVIRNFKRVAEYDFSIEPPARSWYSKEVDGVWMWVEGCDLCNGEREDYCYVRCDQHDVCVDCGTTRESAVINPHGAVWGVRGGWQCHQCHEKERQTRVSAAHARIAARDEEEDKSTEMEDKPTCPWCGATFEPEGEDYGADEKVIECYDCEREYKLTAEHVVYWNAKRA